MSMSAEAWAARQLFQWLDPGSPEARSHQPFQDALKKASATQMKGLSRVANEAEVAEQVTTLVRYQMGRVKDPVPPVVGGRIIDEIVKIQRDVAKELGDAASREDRDLLEMQRVRALLGQIVRWHSILAREVEGGAHAKR